MSNMSYCRFRNTLPDLRDCYDALCESSDPFCNMSEEESKAARKLLKVCKQIADDFEFEIESGT